MANSVLIFTINGARFGIDASRVVMIGELFPLYPIPKLPDYVAGIGSLHGEIVPVVDLCRLWGIEHTGEYRLVVLLRRGEDDVAFMADEVIDVKKSAMPANRETGEDIYIEAAGRDSIAMIDVENTLERIFKNGE